MTKANQPYTASDNWGTPDPRDPGAYPAPTTTSMKQWAWEFLRRRVDYRRAWQERVQPFVNGHTFDLGAVYRYNIEALKRANDEGRPFHERPPWDALCAGFEVFGDPASPASHNSTLDPGRELPPWFKGLGVTYVELYTRTFVPPPMMLIPFDPRLPIEPQLEGARCALRLAAKKHKARHPTVRMPVDKFPEYLRLLDFREVKTPGKEIRAHLFPDIRDAVMYAKINQSNNYARRWQRDYWYIALHD